MDCFRIRREFTTYSKEEKKRYLQAYYKITTEEPLKSRFIKFISIHANWFWKGWLFFWDWLNFREIFGLHASVFSSILEKKRDH